MKLVRRRADKKVGGDILQIDFLLAIGSWKTIVKNYSLKTPKG